MKHSVDFNLGKVESLCHELFNTFATQDWESYCQHGKTAEDFFAAKVA